MEILVCVKRVPATGGQITLTADAQDIDTRFLGFTVSPHEECAVEEAVRLVETHGGSTTVMTLGPAEAEDQLREAMAIGANRGILLDSGGRDWDPVATAAALTDAIQALEAANGPFDLLLFGNESADSGGFQVGIRVAVALDRPCVIGVKALEVRDGMAIAQREAGNAREVYEVPLPAVVAVKEGINLPRYPSVPGRLRARKAPLDVVTPDERAGGPTKVRLVVPQREATTATVLGTGADAAPRVVEVLQQLGAGAVMILVLVEHADGRPDRASLEALVIARRLAGGGAGPDRGGPRRRGRRGCLRLARTAGRRDSAPRRRIPIARSATRPLPGRPPSWQFMGAQRAAAVIASGTDRGNEVMAYVGARAGLPLATNCTGGGAYGRRSASVELTRQRWAGSLIEEARLAASTALLTVAPHAVAEASRRCRRGARRSMSSPRPSRRRTCAARSSGRIEPDGRQGLARRCHESWSAEDGASARPRASPSSRSWPALLGGAVGVSRVVTSAGWRPHAEQVGQTGLRIAPDLYIACGISGAIQHIVGCQAAKVILAINKDAEAPIMQRARYAVIGDLHAIVPAISAEVRRVTGT